MKKFIFFKVKGRFWRRSMQILGLVIILQMAFLSFKANQSSQITVPSTLLNNTLKKCGEKPNCVSSYNNISDSSYIAPTEINFFSLNIADKYFENCKINEQSDYYRHYTCSSRFFKFIDDVEIYFYDGKLWYRSASRVGYSDLGANKQRIQGFKEYLDLIK